MNDPTRLATGVKADRSAHKVGHKEEVYLPDLDMIVVVPPDDLHYSISMDAPKGGLLLCEKLLAMTAPQVDEIPDATQARGLVHMAMFEWHTLLEN